MGPIVAGGREAATIVTDATHSLVTRAKPFDCAIVVCAIAVLVSRAVIRARSFDG